jgi:hypothetical protein
MRERFFTEEIAEEESPVVGLPRETKDYGDVFGPAVGIS